MAAKSRGGGGRRTEEEVLSLLEAAQDILEREREQQPKGQLTMQAEIRSVTVLHQKHLLVLFTLYYVQLSLYYILLYLSLFLMYFFNNFLKKQNVQKSKIYYRAK